MRRDVPRLLQHGITALALKTEPGAAGALVALADRIELWPVDRLRPYERNPRTHSEAQVDQIAASMVEFGWTNPILVDENAGILAGHGRLLAARKLGLTEVPVIRFEHLSEAQKRAYLIADNQLALEAGWDDALLAEELAWLRDERFDLDLIGFDASELERLLAIADGETASEDDVPDPTIAALTGRIDVRFADIMLIDLAAGGTPVDLEFAYTLSAQAKLVLTAHEVYLPKPKLAVEGPGGVQASFDFRGAKNTAAGRMLTVTLTNNLDGAVYA